MEARTLLSGPKSKDWQKVEPELYKRYVASSLAILGIDIPEDVELAADIVAHWAASGATVVPYKQWRESRFEVMKKWAHDLEHLGM